MNPALLGSTVEIGQHVQRNLFGLTFNIDDLISVGAAMLIIVGLGLWLRAKATSGVPGRLQLAFETVVSAVDRQVGASMGPKGAFAAPLAVTLFVFILICNWFEIIPTVVPGHHEWLPSPTGDINLPLAMAFVVFFLINFTWIRLHGIGGYLKHFTQPYKILTPINFIEEMVKPLTLTLRLFGNLFASSILLGLIALFPAKWILPTPFFDIVWKLFSGGFVAPVQAFIFALLSLIYLESAVNGGH
ncbi:MAG: F0F1 ATP synthase subunit A [Acidimicrobiales bacterium]